MKYVKAGVITCKFKEEDPSSSKFSELVYYIYKDEKLEPMNKLVMNVEGNFDGIRMPSMEIKHSGSNKFDMGPIQPCTKLIALPDENIYNITIHLEMLGYIAYMNLFATTIKKKIMTGFVAFIYKGYENGRLLVDTLFEDGVREPHNDYAASLSPLDMEVPGVWSWEVNLPGMFYTNPRTKETKLYLTILLEHSLFPKSCRNPTNGKSSYRVKNTPPNPDMQDASNWGIMVKLLSMMQGDEGRTVYYEPTKTVNWIDLDSFEPCLTEKDHNYFVGLANLLPTRLLIHHSRLIHLAVSNLLNGTLDTLVSSLNSLSSPSLVNPVSKLV